MDIQLDRMEYTQLNTSIYEINEFYFVARPKSTSPEV